MKFFMILHKYYYTILPTLALGILVITHENSLLYKTILVLVVSIGIINILIFNYLLSSVGIAAHDCQPLLYSLIARNPLPLRMKFKTLSLIERLSGPLIGFYCYELFAFNNYEFYLFVVNCVSFFILFSNLFIK